MWFLSSPTKGIKSLLELEPLADAPLESAEGEIPLGKIPAYRSNMPLIFKNAW